MHTATTNISDGKLCPKRLKSSPVGCPENTQNKSGHRGNLGCLMLEISKEALLSYLPSDLSPL